MPRDHRISLAAYTGRGTNDGDSSYGPGITQLEIDAARVAREWILFNELDLMMQIADARG